MEGDTFAPVGEGKINWKKQIEALLKNKYEGYASFETSYRRREGEKAERMQKEGPIIIAFIY